MKSISTMLILLFSLVSLSTSFAGEVRTLALENGLEVVMMPDASSPLLSSILVVRTGTSYETIATAGSTHLLEHMLFRGTSNRTQTEIYDTLDKMGAYYNAQTTETYTTFILVTSSDDAIKAMEIQADMVLNSTVDADTLEIEKGRVIAEIKQSYGRASYPAEIVHLRNLYGKTSYSFPTLGSVEGIRNMLQPTVVKFHHDWYAVNNMTLVLRGNLTFGEMEKLAIDIYGNEAARPLSERPKAWPVGFDDWHQGDVHVSYGDVKSGTLKLTIPAPRFDDGDFPAFSVIASKLDEAIENSLHGPGMPLITYSYSSVVNDPNFSVLDIQAGLMPGADPKVVAEKIMNAVKSMNEIEYPQNEINRIVNADRRMGLFFGEQVQYGAFLLIPKLAVAPWGFWEALDAKMDKVDQESIEFTANKWFDDPYWVSTAFLPRGDEDVNGGVTLSDVAIDTLDNGVVIIARQVSGAPVAGVHLIAKNRSLLESDSKRGWSDIVHRLILEGNESLEIELDEIGMELKTVDDPRVPMDDYRTTPEYSYMRAQVVAENWDQSVKLLGRLVENSDLNQEDLDKVAGDLKSSIDRKTGSLRSVAGSKFRNMLYGKNLFSMPVYGNGSTLENINLEDLKYFRSELFAGNNIVLSIMAPASTEEILGISRIAFEGLIKNEKLFVSNLSPVSISGEEEVTGTGRQGRLNSGFIINDVDPADEAALIVANAMVSDMIYRDLGEAKGWAYGAGSSLMVRDGWASWSVSMGLPEEHLSESKDIVYDYLKTIAKGDFDEHKMEVARGDRRGKILRRYSSRINLAMALGSDYFLKGDALHTWKLFDAIQNVTLSDVKSAAKKYLSKPKNIVTVTGIPDKEAKPKPPMGMGGMMGH
jgi:zinc protease